MPPFAFFKGDFVPLSEAKVGNYDPRSQLRYRCLRGHSRQLERRGQARSISSASRSTTSGCTRVPAS